MNLITGINLAIVAVCLWMVLRTPRRGRHRGRVVGTVTRRGGHIHVHMDKELTGLEVAFIGQSLLDVGREREYADGGIEQLEQWMEDRS